MIKEHLKWKTQTIPEQIAYKFKKIIKEMEHEKDLKTGWKEYIIEILDVYTDKKSDFDNDHKIFTTTRCPECQKYCSDTFYGKFTMSFKRKCECGHLWKETPFKTFEREAQRFNNLGIGMDINWRFPAQDPKQVVHIETIL